MMQNIYFGRSLRRISWFAAGQAAAGCECHPTLSQSSLTLVRELIWSPEPEKALKKMQDTDKSL